jgi:hypothetical protein
LKSPASPAVQPTALQFGSTDRSEALAVRLGRFKRRAPSDRERQVRPTGFWNRVPGGALWISPRYQTRVVSSPGPSLASRRVGALTQCARFRPRWKMKPPRIDPGLRELIGLSLIAGGACALALSRGRFLFVGFFAAACAMTINEAMRRSR